VFSFLPATRLVVSCNSLPATRDLSHGYFRRLLIIEWRFRPAEPDTALDEKLAAELPGLFNRAMAGLQRFRARGCRFAVMPESDRLKSEYQQSQDVCRRDPDRAVPVGDLYRAFVAWRRAKGYRHESDEHVFGRRLTELGLPKSEQRRNKKGLNHKVRPGLELDRAALQAALGPEAWRRFSGPREPPPDAGW
jgi:putative DNA primase/helicase